MNAYIMLGKYILKTITRGKKKKKKGPKSIVLDSKLSEVLLLSSFLFDTTNTSVNQPDMDNQPITCKYNRIYILTHIVSFS